MTDLTEEQIEQQIKEAVGKNDWSAVKKLASELDKIAKAEQAKAKAELQTRLESLGNEVKGYFTFIIGAMTSGNKLEQDSLKQFANKLRNLTGKELDGADGVWYAHDFTPGEGLSNYEPGIRLTKGAKKAAGDGSKRVYVSDNRKSDELLAIIGDQVMFAVDTERVVDKVPHTFPAGTTYKAAYSFSTNGNWRFGVRNSMIKALANQQ